ncbi:MAG: Fe-S-binding domain-containing protein, partial [Desulfurella sp.]
LFAAVYMLTMFKRVVFLKPLNPKLLKLTDFNLREWIYMVPLVVFVFWIGIYPNTFLSKMHASVNHLIEQTKITNVNPNLNGKVSFDNKVIIKKSGLKG